MGLVLHNEITLCHTHSCITLSVSPSPQSQGGKSISYPAVLSSSADVPIAKGNITHVTSGMARGAPQWTSKTQAGASPLWLPRQERHSYLFDRIGDKEIRCSDKRGLWTDGVTYGAQCHPWTKHREELETVPPSQSPISLLIEDSVVLIPVFGVRTLAHSSLVTVWRHVP